jgi:hypothetical protein
MHCPQCGNENPYGLKYCKRCGWTLYTQPQETGQFAPPPRNTGAAWAIALASIVICLGGLGIVVSHAFDLLQPMRPDMVRPGDPAPIAITMIVFGSATIFGVIALLIRLFTRIMGISEPRDETAKSAGPFQRNTSPQQAQLSPPPSSIPSVTENTTRTFDPIYRDPGVRD